MTQEQRERIAEKVAEIAKSNRELLGVVMEMEDENPIKFVKATEKIGAGAMELLNQIA